MEYLSEIDVNEIKHWDQENYWWYVVRNNWVQDAIFEARQRFGSVRLVDVGCGPGGVLQWMCRRHKLDYVLGMEGDERFLEMAREKNLPVQKQDFYEEFKLPEKPNLWFCLDVLEHMKKENGLLGNIRNASEKGALLVVTVPAHPFLYSPWDAEAGHYRRYTQQGLRDSLTKYNWRVVKMFNFFSFLVPIAFAMRVMMRQEHKVPRMSNCMNQILTQLGLLERRLPPLPFGTSLFCLAEAI